MLSRFLLIDSKYDGSLAMLIPISSMLMPTTMRVSVPPVRYSDPEYVVPSKHVILKPFQGQPRKYAKNHRFPYLIIRKSKIRNAGFGLFLGEDVKAGQPITRFATKQISESEAKILKKKVKIGFVELTRSCMTFSQLQGNRHIRANHSACICLDSKPSSSRGYDYFAQCHEAAGIANSSKSPNSKFVDVGFDSILEAKSFMKKGTEVLSNYDDDTIAF
jgi:hypothetical protein